MKLKFLFSLKQMPPPHAIYISHIEGYQYYSYEHIPFKIGDRVKFSKHYFTSTLARKKQPHYTYKIIGFSKTTKDQDGDGGNVIAELEGPGLKISTTFCLAWLKQPIKLNVKKL